MRSASWIVAAALVVGLMFTGGQAIGAIAEVVDETHWDGGMSLVAGELVAQDTWVNSGATLDWLITFDEQSLTYTYNYVLTVSADGARGISHLILEVSDGLAFGEAFGFGDIWNLKVNGFDLNDQGGDSPADQNGDPDDDDPDQDIEVQGFTAGGSNPGMPVDMFGLKFQPVGIGSDVWDIQFDTHRIPVWGDVYAKGGRDSGIWNLAFGEDDTLANAIDDGDGEETPYYVKLPRPDGVAIPEPASVLVWSLLAVGGIALGWYRRRK